MAADGPILLYHRDGVVAHQIYLQNTGLKVAHDTIDQLAGQRFTCYVTETGQSFSFPLHDLVAASEPSDYKPVQRMLVVSDIEGNFKGLAYLLRQAGVMDESFRWHYGQGHLVFVGDLFDRGLQVTECLWLLYKLEAEAQRAGGRVHFILGNHDQMNLTGQYKYLRRKYRHNADTLGLPYSKWYTSQSVLGRWLRTKNVVERIGDVLFVHGGISPQVAQHRLPLATINQLARTSLDTNLRLPHPAAQGVDSPSMLGPTWYRGMAQEEMSLGQVESVAKQYGVQRIIIGHTPVEDIRLLSNQRVIAIDLPHQQNIDQGVMKALLIEEGKFYRYATTGLKQRFL
ncbi:metallophosphoesterase [Spirosoma pomorum]